MPKESPHKNHTANAYYLSKLMPRVERKGFTIPYLRIDFRVQPEKALILHFVWGLRIIFIEFPPETDRFKYAQHLKRLSKWKSNKEKKCLPLIIFFSSLSRVIYIGTIHPSRQRRIINLFIAI